MHSSKHLCQPRSTSAFGDPTDLSTVELMALGDHLGLCRSPHGLLFALRCAAETSRGFVASRCVTTLVITMLFAGLTAWVLQ